MNHASTTASVSSAQSRHSRAAANDSAHKAPAHAWITLTLRRLEPLVAGSIAAYTAWIALVTLAGTPGLWLAVGYAALIAKWCSVRPAHHQVEVFLRGAALVAGAWVLESQLHVQAAGPGGLMFFWLAITVLYYAFMLRTVWAVSLIVLAMLAYVVSQWQDVGIRWEQVAAPIGFLAIFPMAVAMRFGAAMRRPDETVELSRCDPSTALYNRDGLLEHGAELLRECVAEGKAASLVMFDCTDLHELRMVYGRSISRKVMARLVRKLNAIAGERGLAARTESAEFVLLLPGLSPEKARCAVQRVLGRTACIEFDAGDSEIMMLPGVAVRAVDPATDDLAVALAWSHAELYKARRDKELRENYLTRERERHSRPSPLAAFAIAPAKHSEFRAAPAQTMPVPLMRA